MNLITTLLAIVLITMATSCATAQTPSNDNTEQGLAAQYPNDKNIKNDPAVIFTADFEGDDKLIGWTKLRNRNTITTTSDPDIVHTGSTSAQIIATRDKDSGGALIYRWADGVDTLYFRFYCRFHKDTCHPHHFANIGANCPGRETEGHAGSRPKGHEGFSTTIEPPSLDGEKDWSLYSYWHEMHSFENNDGIPNNPHDGDGHSFYGNSFRVDNPSHKFERGKWTCVEFMLKANTPGKYDGEQAAWINGEKIMHWKANCIEGTWHRDRFRFKGIWNKNPKPFEGFNWRSDPNLKINRINLQWYVSPRALEKATVEENIVYFDNVVIATKYIGPIKNN